MPHVKANRLVKQRGLYHTGTFRLGSRKYISECNISQVSTARIQAQTTTTERTTKKALLDGFVSRNFWLFCRPTACRYARIGCRWKGPHQALAEHESGCVLPSKSGIEIMDALEALDMKQAEEQKLYKTVFSLLSFEKITFNDLQLKPYRTDDFITQLFYESSRFTTFGYQWSIRATLNSGECKNPSHSMRRSMQYQLSLKSSSPAHPIRLHFLILKGPYGEMKINPTIYEHEFSSKEPDSGFKELPLIDSTECNKILAMKTINLRIILFHVIS